MFNFQGLIDGIAKAVNELMTVPDAEPIRIGFALVCVAAAMFSAARIGWRAFRWRTG